MQITHFKSNIVPDFTGTVTVYDNSGSTQTVAATDLVRPSDWNSAHAMAITLTGNTAGVSTVSGSNIIWSGGPNVTLSGTAGSVVFSAGAGGGGGVALSAGANSVSNGTVVFSNSNGLTFGLNGSTVTASHNGLTTQTVQTQSNIAGISAGANSVGTGTVVFSNSHNMSFGLNGQTVTGSASYSQSTAPGALAAGTQTATSGTIVFSDSNGITFGLSGSTRVTASHNGLTSQSNQNVTAGNGGFAFQTLSFSNVNGISFGTSAGSAITASHNALTSQSNQAFSAAGGSSAFQTLSFSNANGATFSNNAGQVQLSYTVPTVPAQLSVGNSNLGNTAGDTGVFTGRVVLVGSNNITLSGSTNGGSQTISIIGGAGGAGFSAGVSGGNTAGDTGATGTRVVFAGGNNVTLSQATNANGATITVSGANAVAQTNQTLGLYAVSNTTGQSSSTTVDARTLSFHGAGIASVGYSGGSVVISVPSGGGAGDGVVSLGMSTEGNTAGTTGTVSSGRYIMVGSGPISLSQSLNGQSGTLSILGPATSSLSATGLVSISTNGSTISIGVPGYTKSGYNPYADLAGVIIQPGQGTLQFDPLYLGGPVQYDRLVFGLNNTNSSNSSGSHTLSFWVGIYTRNASTLSLLQSTSSSTAITHSGTAGSYSLYSGLRLFTIPHTSTLTQGDYWLGFVSRTTSGGTNGSYSNLGCSWINSNFLGHFGSSHNTTYQLTLGQGVYSATTSGMPSSVGFTQIRGSDSAALRAVKIMFASGTV